MTVDEFIGSCQFLLHTRGKQVSPSTIIYDDTVLRCEWNLGETPTQHFWAKVTPNDELLVYIVGTTYRVKISEEDFDYWGHLKSHIDQLLVLERLSRACQ
jgi:hypothetical protein